MGAFVAVANVAGGLCRWGLMSLGAYVVIPSGYELFEQHIHVHEYEDEEKDTEKQIWNLLRDVTFRKKAWKYRLPWKDRRNLNSAA